MKINRDFSIQNTLLIAALFGIFPSAVSLAQDLHRTVTSGKQSREAAFFLKRPIAHTLKIPGNAYYIGSRSEKSPEKFGNSKSEQFYSEQTVFQNLSYQDEEDQSQQDNNKIIQLSTRDTLDILSRLIKNRKFPIPPNNNLFSKWEQPSPDTYVQGLDLKNSNFFVFAPIETKGKVYYFFQGNLSEFYEPEMNTTHFDDDPETKFITMANVGILFSSVDFKFGQQNQVIKSEKVGKWVMGESIFKKGGYIIGLSEMGITLSNGEVIPDIILSEKPFSVFVKNPGAIFQLGLSPLEESKNAFFLEILGQKYILTIVP